MWTPIKQVSYLNKQGATRNHTYYELDLIGPSHAKGCRPLHKTTVVVVGSMFAKSQILLFWGLYDISLEFFKILWRDPWRSLFFSKIPRVLL